jgi:hypothetical protein
MITVTDAYLAEHVEQKLDGSWRIEGDHLAQVPIGLDGAARVKLVVHHRRPKLGGPSSIDVYLEHPSGAHETLPLLDVPPQQFVGQEGVVWFGYRIKEAEKGNYKLSVTGSAGGQVVVPFEVIEQQPIGGPPTGAVD